MQKANFTTEADCLLKRCIHKWHLLIWNEIHLENLPDSCERIFCCPAVIPELEWFRNTAFQWWKIGWVFVATDDVTNADIVCGKKGRCLRLSLQSASQSGSRRTSDCRSAMNREGGGADKEVEEDKHTERQEKAEKADKEKTVPKAQQTPGWVLSLNTNHHQIRGPSKANLCSDWVKAESTHVCLNTYLQQILIYEKHGMLQKWCSQLKPILWHTHCKLNKNKTIWVYWGLCTKHGFLVTERVNFKSPPIFSFTILIKHRPKGTSHMLEKGTLSTPSSNNFLFFFNLLLFYKTASLN